MSTSFPISVASATDIGGCSVQQDKVAISADLLRVVLCDGHGRIGHNFAQAVCDFQMGSTLGSPNELFAATDAHLRTLYGPDKVQFISGTSCTHLTVDPVTREMTVANIGDSSVRYWDCLGAGVAASVDHSPKDVGEFERTTAAGGACLFHNVKDQYPKGKQSVYIRNADGALVYNASGGYYYKNCHLEFACYLESPENSYSLAPIHRLAMTRAFGDWPLVPYGVVAEPSVTVVPAAAGVRAVVAASDGLWDVMKNEDIGAIVLRPEFLGNAVAASQALLEAALAAGKRLFGPGQDNTTVVVAYI